jgi:hypothetical protein
VKPNEIGFSFYSLLYPVESPTTDGGCEEKNVHSLLRVEFKAPPFLTGLILY